VLFALILFLFFRVDQSGGVTWQATKTNGYTCIGGIPLIQPNGVVVVPSADANENNIIAWMSRNGGKSWTSPVLVSSISYHRVSGPMRADPLPSAEVDGSGRVFIVWHDCRFRVNCNSNDLVICSSLNGVSEIF
jgi:hypothetical protein